MVLPPPSLARLEAELKRMAQNQVLRVRWAKTEEDVAVPLLLISDPRRALTMSYLGLLVGWVRRGDVI